MKINALVLSVCLLAPLLAQADAEALKIITVRGEGELKVAPDIAHLNINIWAKDGDAKDAQEAAAKEYERVTKLLREKFKIEAKDIKTANVSLMPEYDYNNGKQKLRGYAAYHRLAVNVRALDKLGNIVDGLPTDDASKDKGASLENIDFASEKRSKYENEALALAMANARERADAIAKAAGQTIVGLLRVTDSQSSQVFEPLLRGGLEMASMSAGMAKGRSAQTQVSPGEITITTNIQAQFSF